MGHSVLDQDQLGSSAPAERQLPTRLLTTRHPLLYEINARVWLATISHQAGRALTLADVPDDIIDAIAARGFDLVWLMGVWTTGEIGRRIALEHPGLQTEYATALPDWTPADVVGSPYSVGAYEVSPTLGGRDALAVLRQRLADRGIGLMLDFIPNHTAIDNQLAHDHPECYVQGEAGEDETRPDDFIRLETAHGPRILAHGRDPYFPPWTDSLQLNAMHTGLREAHIKILRDIAGQCDGVRCDMAMLMLGDVFNRTWGKRATRQLGPATATGEYWTEMIGAIRQERPSFIFMAEVYWDLESRILEQGFNYAYDKRLYDRLRHGDPDSINVHLNAHPDFQQRMARFTENHDEDRAAATFAGARLAAVATLAYTLPGLKLMHEGQLTGLKQRLPVQLGRRHDEATTAGAEGFHHRLLAALADPIFRIGSWNRLNPEPAWEGNGSHELIIAHIWNGGYLGSRIVAVNLGDSQTQCRVRFDTSGLGGNDLRFRDLLGQERFRRGRQEVIDDGLFLDLAPYQAQIFAVDPVPRAD